MNKPPTYDVRDEDSQNVCLSRAGKCKCGGSFTTETYTPTGTEERVHRVTHTVPACHQFHSLSAVQYLAWNAQTGKPN